MRPSPPEQILTFGTDTGAAGPVAANGGIHTLLADVNPGGILWATLVQQVDQGKQLLDSGAFSQQEFEAKALG